MTIPTNAPEGANASYLDAVMGGRRQEECDLIKNYQTMIGLAYRP
ncbi:hypothetical protein J2851_002983 [Azospirillum rugosum]|uniref:Uncharacterized protein n=1 Tax=Azospirillum rugosum TaxID=416170 RepID=A0ABS4SKW4_9PROT|nr:hypothetical protein [Azospirillum rugosum]MDQ0526750.1 hypothetical protein [Azospirillum rugosum]